ncbi:hypothetical protein CPT_MarsHill_110 [Staphylococcus phage MarsHill]|nr:hypothetical protein CPT_MarsHill_110 [Staphylococcus phage MarsHill]QQO92764.1 hypothetical protein CPT_Madawaska_110 [Staphylococcus phage Madawaska]
MEKYYKFNLFECILKSIGMHSDEYENVIRNINKNFTSLYFYDYEVNNSNIDELIYNNIHEQLIDNGYFLFEVNEEEKILIDFENNLLYDKYNEKIGMVSLNRITSSRVNLFSDFENKYRDLIFMEKEDIKYENLIDMGFNIVPTFETSIVCKNKINNFGFYSFDIKNIKYKLLIECDEKEFKLNKIKDNFI